MKEIRRSRRLCLPRRRHQLTKPITSDNDESDFEHQTVQQKSIVRSNKNANRMPTTVFDTITKLSIEEKQQQILHSSSEQSSLFRYSISSIQKPTTMSDDLTPLTITTTNTTPLTALTCSNTKQTETATVKIDLTQLSGTDTLGSSPTNSDHDQSLSLNRKLSSPNINNMKDLTQTYDTDTSMRSITFSRDNSLEQELSYPKHASCFTIPGVGNGDCMIIESSSAIEGVSLPATVNTNINTCQQAPVRWSPSRWNLSNMTSKGKLLVGCSSLSLIAGLVIFLIIL
jgi:hypothetical protein